MSTIPKTGTLWASSKKGMCVFDLEEAKYNSNHFYKIKNVIDITPEIILMYLGDSELQVINLKYDSIMDTIEETYVKENTATFLLDSKVVYVFYDDYEDLWEKDVNMKYVTECNT